MGDNPKFGLRYVGLDEFPTGGRGNQVSDSAVPRDRVEPGGIASCNRSMELIADIELIPHYILAKSHDIGTQELGNLPVLDQLIDHGMLSLQVYYSVFGGRGGSLIRKDGAFESEVSVKNLCNLGRRIPVDLLSYHPI